MDDFEPVFEEVVPDDCDPLCDRFDMVCECLDPVWEESDLLWDTWPDPLWCEL